MKSGNRQNVRQSPDLVESLRLCIQKLPIADDHRRQYPRIALAHRLKVDLFNPLAKLPEGFRRLPLRTHLSIKCRAFHRKIKSARKIISLRIKRTLI